VRCALALLVVAGCGGAAPAKPTPVSAPKLTPPPPPPSCARVADHVRRLIDPKQDPEITRRVRQAFDERCEQDQWSGEVRTCITSTRSLADPKHCKDLLAGPQREALDRDLAAAESSTTSVAGLPDTCADYGRMIDRLQGCQQLPQQTRDALKQSYDQVEQVWLTVPEEGREALREACKAAVDAVEQIGRSTCGW